MENDETNGSGTLDRSQEDAELRFADDEAVGVRKADAPACEDGTVAGARAPGPLLPWLPSIPLFFLGLGVYRAWIEIVFVGSFVEFPAAAVAGHDAFDLVMIATMFLCAALAKRIGPLFGKRSLYAVSGVALTVSTLCMFASIWIPRSADALAVPAVLLGGFGIALVILLWSELYGCLNPFRVALYYSASMIVAALLIYLCRGLLLPWLGAVVLVLPVVSLAACAAGFRSLPSGELPRAKPSKFSFPWKIVLLMAIYAFAYGLKESSMYQSTFGPHSASYTAFSILIMLIMANLCYRYGMSAVWLFGIERGVRALFTLFGRQTEQLLGAPSFGLAGSDAVVSGLVVILVVAATMILFSEKELSSRWGVSFLGEDGAAGDRAIVKKQELANRCQELARSYGLSPREEEVLLLLAQRKTVGSIERELFIANGTAKTHIRHIYRKLDIHSRDELSDLLGLFE